MIKFKVPDLQHKSQTLCSTNFHREEICATSRSFPIKIVRKIVLDHEENFINLRMRIKVASKNSTFHGITLHFKKIFKRFVFLLKYFHFFFNLIARHTQLKEKNKVEIFLRKFRKSPAEQFLEIALNL